MLCALYAYKGSYEKTLDFTAGDRFLGIGHSRDPNWMHVVNEVGHIGYIPKNFVACEQVSPLQMVGQIKLCIKSIHDNAAMKDSKYSKNETETLQRLNELQIKWSARVPTISKKKRPPPQPPSQNIQNEQDKLKEDLHRDTIQEEATSFIQRGMSLDTSNETDSCTKEESDLCSIKKDVNKIELQISPEVTVFRRLVEEVREKTNINFSTSNQVVEIVLAALSTHYPDLRSTLNPLLDCRDDGGTILNHDFEDSVDGRTLLEFLEKLRQCKDDQQQRSWALYEDETTIEKFLNRILDILNDGNSEACRAVLQMDDFRPLLTIVQYYQMETRWSLRKLLLQIFGCICQLSESHISYLSASVLPTELSREILDPETSVEKLGYTVLVLGMILSTGDTLPYTHFRFMNDVFIENLFLSIEHFNKSQDTEDLCEMYLCLILAFNLQYHKPTLESWNNRNNSQNAVIRVLSKCKEVNVFIEKLLILFNREDDPVAMFDFGTRPMNSVLCMMRDIYNNGKTAAHLYTNDEKVICDILLRQLTDLPPDHKRHYDYLRLLEGVLMNGKWVEHQHLSEDLDSRLSLICSEAENPTEADNARKVLHILRQICQ